MIRLLVDSAADYLTEELKAANVEMVPLSVTIGEDVFKDEVELSREDLYGALLAGNIPKTSQPSPQDFVDKFEKIKEAGDEVICILLSSALSGTYQSACLAKELVEYDKIYVVDSLTATVAIKIMAEKAQRMIDEGHTAEEIVKELEVLKGRTKILAAIDTLKYLYLGGRVSRTTAVVADAANIKPSLTLDLEGKVAIGSKYLGVGRAVKDIVKKLKAKELDPEHPVYLIYSHVEENVNKLKKALEDKGFEIKEVHELGATLGVHVGPGAFGVIFVEK